MNKLIVLAVLVISLGLPLKGYSERTNAAIANGETGTNYEEVIDPYQSTFRLYLDTGYLIAGLLHNREYGYGIGTELLYVINGYFALSLNYGFGTPTLTINGSSVASFDSMGTGAVRYYILPSLMPIYISSGISFSTITFNYSRYDLYISTLSLPVEFGFGIKGLEDYNIFMEFYGLYYISLFNFHSPEISSLKNDDIRIYTGIRVGLKL